MRPDSDRAREYAVQAVCRAAFHKRKGHGGGPCTRRNLTRKQLQSELHKAISRYEDGLRYFRTKKGPAATFAERLGIRKCAEPDCANPVDMRGADGTDGARCNEHP
jgi:hypothetical protein